MPDLRTQLILIGSRLGSCIGPALRLLQRGRQPAYLASQHLDVHALCSCCKVQLPHCGLTAVHLGACALSSAAAAPLRRSSTPGKAGQR